VVLFIQTKALPLQLLWFTDLSRCGL